MKWTRNASLAETAPVASQVGHAASPMIPATQVGDMESLQSAVSRGSAYRMTLQLLEPMAQAREPHPPPPRMARARQGATADAFMLFLEDGMAQSPFTLVAQKPVADPLCGQRGRV